MTSTRKGSAEYINYLLDNVEKEIDSSISEGQRTYREYERYYQELHNYYMALGRDPYVSVRRPIPPPPSRTPSARNKSLLQTRRIAPDRAHKALIEAYSKGNVQPKSRATVATIQKGKKEDMSYTSREENEDLGAGDGSVAGAVYVRDTVNVNVASIAAKWTHASDVKYVVLTAATIVGLALISTGSILGIVVGITLLATAFFPHLAKRNLLKNDKMIVLESFEGYGAKWQQELHRGFNQLERLTKEAQDPDAPVEIKAAFAEIEPVLWAQALKVAALLNKLRGGSMTDIDADTKMILRNKFVEFKQQVDKIDEVFKIVHSFSVLDLDLSTEVISAEEITGYLRNALDTRKALASQSVTDHDDVSAALADSVKELSGATDNMDGILDSVRASLSASKVKQAEPLRKATA